MKALQETWLLMPVKFLFKKVLTVLLLLMQRQNLFQHYEKTLGAYHFSGQRMIIPTDPAQILIDKYFKS